MSHALWQRAYNKQASYYTQTSAYSVLTHILECEVVRLRYEGHTHGHLFL